MSIAMPNNGGCCCPAGDCEPVADVTILPDGGAAPLLLSANIGAGTAPFLYQWFANVGLGPVAIPGATAPTYFADPAEETSYFVIVTNNCGQAQSPDVLVTTAPPCVPPTVTVDPPQVVTPPTTVPLPNPTLLTALVAGTAPFTYQWFEAPDVLGFPGPFVIIPLATADTYLAAPPARTWFRVVVTNACGQATSEERLVDLPPA